MEESIGFNQLEIVGDLSAIPLARGGHSQIGVCETCLEEGERVSTTLSKSLAIKGMVKGI